MASSELLKQIQAGKRLKQAKTNDRSGPLIDTPKGSGGSSRVGGSSSSASLASGRGPPQLASLFSGGVPKLKPAGQTKLDKPPTLGKPPSVAKPDGSLSQEPPARNLPPPKPPAPVLARPSLPPPKPLTHIPGPAPVVRPAPNIPPRKNNVLANSAPLAPRRAPPTIRNESPPATPPRQRTRSPVEPASPTSRPIPAIPIRGPTLLTSPVKPKVTTSDRAPPPPPPRSSQVAPSPARTAPPPPSRTLPSTAISAAPIDSARTYHLEPTASDRSASPSVPPGTKSPGRVSQLPPPSRRLPAASTNSDRLLPPRSKIPSPTPNAGVHIFPVTDFPPPREFKIIRKLYNSGNQQGSNFNLGIL